METFEYATLSMRFKDEAKGDGKITKGYVDLSYYESDGKSPGKPKVETFNLEGDFERIDHVEVIRNAYSAPEIRTSYPVIVNINYSLIFAIAPYLAMLGKQGWVVIEYKTNADPALAQALLMRKIQE